MDNEHPLTKKLKERLEYLGVYYKRNPQLFFRNLSDSDRQQLLQLLKFQYREIILNYFANKQDLNQRIDELASRFFFTDMSISQVVQIHMELMDDFAQQLKLEGRSDEILLDYRLTLIDIMAHLCEMYRRSVPNESVDNINES
jgi:circadian clock protein KaiA